MLMIITGFSVTMSSFSSFLVLVIPVTIAVLYRIGVEESALLNEFGERYGKYIKATKRLIPWIY